MDDQGDQSSQAALPVLNYGIVGLGNAVGNLLPAFADSDLAKLTAAADLRQDARDGFTANHGAPAFADLPAMLREGDCDVAWIATPNPFHAEHAVMAAEAGKHVVCEKPIAMTIEECDRIIDAVEANGVKFLQGQCKLFQAPVRTMRQIIASGRLGKVVHITAINFNDWLQRPRLAPEVDTDQGGGICYRQAPHHADIVRYLAGVPTVSLRATVNRADPHFATEGNYTAFLSFDGGVAASLVYNAYGYFDVAELTWDIGEGGQVRRRDPDAPPRPRRKGPVSPEELYSQGPRLGRRSPNEERRQPFYGLIIVGCERGIIRQSPDGILVYDEAGVREEPCDPTPARGFEFRELSAAIAEGRPAFPDARWGRATLEVCLGLLASSEQGREVELHYQTGVT